MPRSLSDSFFGSIALKNNYLTREQLTQALRVQWERTRDGAGPSLGEVCRMLGFLREDEVNAVLRAQVKSEIMLEDSLTGEICLRNELCTQEQIDETLEDQRALDHTVRLGDLLCQKGFIDRQQLHAVLKAQTRLKSSRLKPVILPPENPRAAEGWAPAPPPPAPAAKKRHALSKVEGVAAPGKKAPPEAKAPKPKKHAKRK